MDTKTELKIVRGQNEKLLALNVMLLSVLADRVTTRMEALACLRRQGFPHATPQDLDDAFVGVEPPWAEPQETEGLTPVGRVISVDLDDLVPDGQAIIVAETSHDDARRVGLYKRIDLTPIAELDARDAKMAAAVLAVIRDVSGVDTVLDYLDDDGSAVLLGEIADAVRAVRQGNER